MTILNQDILNFTSDGFDYITTNDTAIVTPGVTIASRFDAIFSNKADSTLHNRGNVIGSDAGVFFNNFADDSTITNALGSLIVGQTGVEMDGHGILTFSNSGEVVGAKVNGPSLSIGPNATFASITNKGELLSGFVDVRIESPGIIKNFGSMKAAGAGIDMIVGPPNEVVTIVNKATGVIKGGADSLFSNGGGAFHLNNFGEMVGNVISGTVADNVVKNHGVIQGDVQFGGGDDFFRNFGHAKSGEIFGGDGNDSLIGGKHKDVIHGGNGNDLLTGGNGADKFVFDAALNPATNVDTITDFQPAQHDEIDLKASIFTGIPLGHLDANHFAIGAPTNANPQIDYNPTTGALVYDPDGTGGTAPTLFAVLANHASITLHAGDLVVVA
jgi:Ca2+-binding RTX toxin-like protein